MTVGELKKALDNYPEGAIFRVGVSVPDLFINVPANANINGNHADNDQCTEVRFVAVAPSRFPQLQVPDANPVS